MSISREVRDNFTFGLQLRLQLLINAAGNVLMLSEGGVSAKNVYSLREGRFSWTFEGQYHNSLSRVGVLTLYLDKETYERAGIVGKPDGVKGRRGTKPRWGRLCRSKVATYAH